MYSIYAFFRNVLVQHAEVEHYRAVGILLSKTGDVSAVVTHDCIGVQARSGQPCHGSAKVHKLEPCTQ